MSAGVIIMCIITAYTAGALISAPRLMRLIYQEKMAVLAQEDTRHAEEVARWKARKDKSGLRLPLRHINSTALDYRKEARYEGFWWALVWPFALAFHALGATAFAQEVAAERSAANTKVIADYDRLLDQRFAEELAAVESRSLFGRKKERTK